MNRDVRKNLHIMTTTLMDSVDVLKAKGANEELLALLERAVGIGKMSILYMDSLDEATVSNALLTIKLAEDIVNEPLTEIRDEKCTDLRRVVDSVEDLFRKKRYLLDGAEEKIIA